LDEGGITHALVVEFEDEDDRKYYLEQDPAHMEASKTVHEIVKKAQILDFTAGVF
jgi:hypothetical protein